MTYSYAVIQCEKEGYNDFIGEKGFFSKYVKCVRNNCEKYKSINNVSKE